MALSNNTSADYSYISMFWAHQFNLLKKKKKITLVLPVSLNTCQDFESTRWDMSLEFLFFFPKYTISIVKLLALLDFLRTWCLTCEDTLRSKHIWLLGQLQLAIVSRTVKIHWPTEDIWTYGKDSSLGVLTYWLSKFVIVCK